MLPVQHLTVLRRIGARTNACGLFSRPEPVGHDCRTVEAPVALSRTATKVEFHNLRLQRGPRGKNIRTIALRAIRCQ